MTAILSPANSPATSPPAISSPVTANAAHPALPPLITSPPAPRSQLPRPMSHASKNRLSQYSTTSSLPSRSRPPSHIFPLFPSSLPYTLVRDFAYPPGHPLHYGPPPEPSRPPSGMTTPASEQRRLSDPPTAWDSRGWDGHFWSSGGGGSHGRPADLPSIHLADGPPWSEDEDLQSPVVSSRHRKHHKTSSGGIYGRSRVGREQLMSQDHYGGDRGFYVGTSTDGADRYYINQGNEANGPGGEYVTYPPGQAGHTGNGHPGNGNEPYQIANQQPRGYADEGAYDSDNSSTCSSPGYHNVDESRYSRDYQFTITSPDEEMHGKAVALFDFERENENELPLVEGQIIWVSYRHGQGWLVAEDPRTQESGLVPEEYVRLLRDIEGGMTSLTGQLDTTSPGSPSNATNEAGTPTQTEYQLPQSPATTVGSGSTVTATGTNGFHQPVVSTFSTSSKDLDPYPQHLLGTQAGQPPPQVVHYHGQRGGSQANTPTLLFHNEAGFLRRGSQDVISTTKKGEPGLETLPDAKLESTKRASR
ncbi:HOG (high osmolarity glycerol) pathway protein [Podospora bellae-mahoneyi]|uniref:HOG (High osmolarity glycerol) pathway protein n=1 Tax=Podospora bellae-mahoneyi TaxID=2093777 RepID=A0ABR0FYU1_9PEZI|nr:HOG (high osmolarity glycerol) pathway protein [Podospora bellae-mahoneyi]